MTLIFKRQIWYRNSMGVYFVFGFLTLQLCQTVVVGDMHSSNKLPVRNCPPNQTWYEGDVPGDFVCDCLPGYIFQPIDEKCYRAHTPGPCKQGNEIITLPGGQYEPECQINVCQNDTLIRFKEGCYQLDTQGPCETNHVVKFNLKESKVVCELLPEFQPEFISPRILHND